MKITKILNSSPDSIVAALKGVFNNSRFNAEFYTDGLNINISKVRLKSSKDYCGNHAKACERPAKKDKKTSFLEGADWVEFNDRINNLLDSNKISATVKSTVCEVRKGHSRRIQYDADTFRGSPNNGEWVWNKTAPDNHWKSCLQGEVKEKWSKFPKGTPGIHEGVGYSVKGEFSL